MSFKENLVVYFILYSLIIKINLNQNDLVNFNLILNSLNWKFFRSSLILPFSTCPSAVISGLRSHTLNSTCDRWDFEWRNSPVTSGIQGVTPESILTAGGQVEKGSIYIFLNLFYWAYFWAVSWSFLKTKYCYQI